MLAQTILALALAATALADEPTDRKATHQFTFLSVIKGRVYCDKACPAEGYDLDVPANVPAKDGGWATPDTPLDGPLTVQIDGADGTRGDPYVVTYTHFDGDTRPIGNEKSASSYDPLAHQGQGAWKVPTNPAAEILEVIVTDKNTKAIVYKSGKRLCRKP